ncbi:MAG: VCBS repeat-containing protein [Ignavibacteriae bacterium]|nr:VCBS repeat-containing protein [Ignavibacteriota bacterium]MCB9214797.1 VCBS repeat-containing protein [Ignavibacteria bacterium]
MHKNRTNYHHTVFVLLLTFLSWVNIISCSQADVSSPSSDNLTEEKSLQPRFVDVSEIHLPLSSLQGNSMDMEAADLDEDGDLDLVIANEYRPNIILINDGGGNFRDESVARLPQKYFDSEDIAIADFSCDGHIDIIFVSEDNQVNEYYINDGSGFFSDAADRMIVTGTSNATLAADIDEDGDPDLLIGNAGQNRLLVNDGRGNFTDETSSRLPSIEDITQDLELGDVDGDGDLDLLVGNEDQNRLLINKGKGFFEEKVGSLPLRSEREETREGDFGDIDGDGDLDVIFANVDFQSSSSLLNRLLLNDGSGNFTDVSNQIPASQFHTVDADFADIDRDNDLDLLIGNAFGGGVEIWTNDGRGNFADETDQFIPSLPTIDVIDLELLSLNGNRFLYICAFKGADKLLREEED